MLPAWFVCKQITDDRTTGEFLFSYHIFYTKSSKWYKKTSPIRFKTSEKLNIEANMVRTWKTPCAKARQN